MCSRLSNSHDDVQTYITSAQSREAARTAILYVRRRSRRKMLWKLQKEEKKVGHTQYGFSFIKIHTYVRAHGRAYLRYMYIYYACLFIFARSQTKRAIIQRKNGWRFVGGGGGNVHMCLDSWPGV